MAICVGMWLTSKEKTVDYGRGKRSERSLIAAEQGRARSRGRRHIFTVPVFPRAWKMCEMKPMNEAEHKIAKRTERNFGETQNIPLHAALYS
jgi:hypothetical protein